VSEARQTLFYSECKLCGNAQPCEIPRHTRSLSMECSHCKKVYALLAADTQGRFRYMNEFLTGYAPPARFRKGQSRLEELMTIWQAVARQCRYTKDSGTDNNDAWQTGLETQVMGKGDCEDTSILLADWLLSRGFQARVALGRYAERGGHAWVVVRLDEKDYLLESTEGASHATAPPLLSDLGSRYVPEVLFDREAFYTRHQAIVGWQGDYWAEKTWLRVVPRARQISGVVSAEKP
jgi:predicted transglutaminase-like cysteine proteinase